MLEIKDFQTGKKKPEDTKNWIPTTQEGNLLSELQDEMSVAINFRSNYEDQWKENIERYLAKPFYYEDGRAGVVLPIVKWIIESKQATEMKAPPSFSYEPLDYAEDKAIAKILEDIVKKHVWNLKYVNLDYKLDVLNQDKDILGGMYQYVGWRKIYRTIRKNMKKPDKTGSEAEPENDTKQELYYDDVCVDNIFPQDVWLHPLAMGVFDSPWIKIRKRFDYNTFLETFSDTEMFKNVDKVKKGKWSMPNVASDTIYKEYYSDDKNQVIAFEHWNKMRDELVIIANGVIIYDGPNPFDHKELPFVDYIDRLQFNTYVGEGEPQRIATICDSINAFINIAIDKEKKAGSGINLLDDNLSDFDDVASVFGTSSIARVSNPKDAFVHYEMPGMSGTTSNIISMLMDYLIYATGVDFRQITDLNASTQATVAAIRREIAQGRLNLNVRRNENRGYKRLGWLLMKTVQQFYPIPLVEKLSGNNPEQKEGDQDTAEEGKPIPTEEPAPKEAPQPEGMEGTPAMDAEAPPVEGMPPAPVAPPKPAPLEYRKIRIQGKNISEKPSRDGKFTSNSLKMTKVGNNEYGFFQARPSYIRTKGDLEVRVISESSFSASKELEKANAKDYVQMTGSAVEMDPATGQAKPILSMKYGLKKYIDAMGYDPEAAFDLKDSGTDHTAQDEAAKLLGGGGPPAAESPQFALKEDVPPDGKSASLTGANSEPVQQLRAQLGSANNAIQK